MSAWKCLFRQLHTDPKCYAFLDMDPIQGNKLIEHSWRWIKTTEVSSLNNITVGSSHKQLSLNAVVFHISQFLQIKSGKGMSDYWREFHGLLQSFIQTISIRGSIFLEANGFPQPMFWLLAVCLLSLFIHSFTLEANQEEVTIIYFLRHSFTLY